MSRIAKSPITIPDSVEVSQSGEVLTVKGKLRRKKRLGSSRNSKG